MLEITKPAVALQAIHLLRTLQPQGYNRPSLSALCLPPSPKACLWAGVQSCAPGVPTEEAKTEQSTGSSWEQNPSSLSGSNPDWRSRKFADRDNDPDVLICLHLSLQPVLFFFQLLLLTMFLGKKIHKKIHLLTFTCATLNSGA